MAKSHDIKVKVSYVLIKAAYSLRYASDIPVSVQHVDESMTAEDQLDRIVAYVRDLMEIVTPVELPALTLDRGPAADSFAANDLINIAMNRYVSLADSFGVTDSLQQAMSHPQLPTDQAIPLDTATLSVALALAEVMVATDQISGTGISQSSASSAADAAAAADAFGLDFGAAPADAAAAVDAFSFIVGLVRDAFETISPVDVLAADYTKQNTDSQPAIDAGSLFNTGYADDYFAEQYVGDARTF